MAVKPVAIPRGDGLGVPERLRGIRRDVQTVRLADVIDDWQRARRRLGDAPGTEVAYQWGLNHFLRFTAARRLELVREIEPEDIEDFQDTLVQGGASKQSQRLAATALRELFRWAAARRLVPAELHLAVARVRVPRGQPRPIPERDLRLLLAYVLMRRPGASLTDLRDRSLALYLLGSGARISEVLQLTRRDFEAPIVTQKGGGSHRLLVPPLVIEAVLEYLKRRGEDECPWLWVTLDNNRPRRRLTSEGALAIWPRVARRAGIPRFTSHQLRHSSASVLLNRRVQESVIASHLGHADLSTVLNYARLDPLRREEAVQAMNDYLEEIADETLGRPGYRRR